MSITNDHQAVWAQLLEQAEILQQSEPLLEEWVKSIFEKDFAYALALILATRLGTKRLSSQAWIEILVPFFNSNKGIDPIGINVSSNFQPPEINQVIIKDLKAAIDRDPASQSLIQALLFSKGYHALCAYRAMHNLWHEGRKSLSHYLQSRVSKVFSIDIHPEAVIGSGIFIDHGSGLVIGATAVVEDNVSLMQQVTLGGTGKDSEDRHPKVRNHALIGPGTQVLGNIEVGECSMVHPASVVLKSVLPRTCVAGVPAQIVSDCEHSHPSTIMSW